MFVLNFFYSNLICYVFVFNYFYVIFNSCLLCLNIYFNDLINILKKKLAY